MISFQSPSSVAGAVNSSSTWRKREVLYSNVRAKGRKSLSAFRSLPLLLSTHTCKIGKLSLQYVFLRCGDTEMLGIIQCKKGVGYCSHDKLLLNIKNKGNVTLPCNTFSAFPLSSVLCFLSKAPDFTLRLGSESHSIVWLCWVICIV